MNYRKDFIPRNTAHSRRPGNAMNATTITIHNTGNASSSAANERAWLTNPSNTRTASFHIVVDEREALECIPLNENAWHAGDGSGAKSGNRTSIGIEICESGNYAKTLDNAAGLVAQMLKERGWGVDRLRRHYDWSGKVCPRLMYDGGKWTGWAEFKAKVSAKLNESKGSEKSVKKDVIVSVKVGGKKIGEGVVDDGVTYVPVRVVAEALGACVTWDGANNAVQIEKGAK
ncbi:N-acetylmuramoyl-L-alanine amidase [Paenibacillus sp. CAA11]|uniref:N-acetylmuramoyl-L-alanine amidase n=1 Tax=Paenibacillus sp. CAA11 TaxID=1532905 RepID=UPI000D363E72|nr:N-acetylmuramoyl-L-alanine amidase [Paenibacillus sp. CAA11]AWB45260.1 N-acetylmuramoyl-L-alanine amidase [Paenibacillus sp. CAA11]